MNNDSKISGSPPMLIRKAFVMAVNPGKAEEYARRHNPIWPELRTALKNHGVHNYSIYYHHSTRQLFAYVEIEDDARWEAIGATDVCQRWWNYMKDVMPTKEDWSPVSATLTELFHID